MGEVSPRSMAEQTAKEKHVLGIYTDWGAGKFNDPEIRDAEIAKYFTEDAFFVTSTPQKPDAGGRIWSNPKGIKNLGAFFAQFGPEAPALVHFDIKDGDLKWIKETPDGCVHVKQFHTQTCLQTKRSVSQVLYQEWAFDEAGMCTGCTNTMGDPAGTDSILDQL